MTHLPPASPADAAALRSLRRLLRARRRAIGPLARRRAAWRLAWHVESAGLLRAGRRIALYLPMAEEIDTGPLLLRALRRGCLVHVPRVTDFRRYQMRFLPLRGPLRRGHYGILEPAAGTSRSAQALDLILMPLVGFDRRGNRIGMGKGYYDRALAFLPRRRHRPRPRLVGLAYACQEVESLPARAHDVPLHAAVTEAGLLRFPPSPAITPGPA